MIVAKRIIYPFILLGLHFHLIGQLSPGDLTKAHAHLEGMSNCTQCHTLGEKVSNQKCMQCHEFLTQRIESRKGFHSSSQVKGKDCFSCHSEHHGRTFQMIRFDEKDFDHQWTGYKLEGAHSNVDCRACHRDENIIDYQIKNIENTYLGLTKECLSCHDDYHRNTLSFKCVNCHTMESFEGAERFDHTTHTNFRLKGEHVHVDCKSCHNNEEAAWNFALNESQECRQCHDDIHQGRLGTQCQQCHTEDGFSFFKGSRSFDHNQTGYPLEGAHQGLDCRRCHEIDQADQVFLDFSTQNTNECTLCHQDIHEGKFGNHCLDCHSVFSFKVTQTPESFNHNLTDFPLLGLHQNVECRECHNYDMTQAVTHNQCIDCHDDYHQGQLVDQYGKVKNCQSCHSEAGFSNPSYNEEDHAKTNFPLDGAHLATPCFACHLQDNERWLFKDLSRNCIDCHENIHQSYISEAFLSNDNCTSCHQTESWTEINFDHNLTQFQLHGKHVQVECRRCHFEEKNGNILTQHFQGLSHDCVDCHEDIHRGQFEHSGVVSCDSCHTPDNWNPSLFNHNQTNFELSGAHLSVDCKKCHVPTLIEQEFFVNFHIEKFECVDCHF